MTAERVVLLLAGLAAVLLGVGLAASPAGLAEACRVANVPLGLVVAFGFFVRVNDAWHRYGLGGRITRVGILGVLLVVAGGSAEAYVTHAELGLRSVVMTLALAVTGCGLALIPNDHD